MVLQRTVKSGVSGMEGAGIDVGQVRHGIDGAHLVSMITLANCNLPLKTAVYGKSGQPCKGD